jgi:hypothetical protein
MPDYGAVNLEHVLGEIQTDRGNLHVVGQLLDKINAGQKPKPLEGAYLVEFRAAPTLKTDGPSTRPAECCPA